MDVCQQPATIPANHQTNLTLGRLFELNFDNSLDTADGRINRGASPRNIPPSFKATEQSAIEYQLGVSVPVSNSTYSTFLHLQLSPTHTLSTFASLYSHHYTMSKQGTYIRIEEDAKPALKVVQLRNVAYSKNTKGCTTMSRMDVMEALMPLSRSPWGTTPTLIKNEDKQRQSTRS